MIASRRLRAPRRHGAVVAEPPLSDVRSLLTANRERLAAMTFDVLGRPGDDLRQQARQTAVAAAREYLREAGEPLPATEPLSLLLAGHQPELFHPGVWVKNFALNGLAHQYGATPLNLVVDNDTVKATALRLPAVRVPLPPVHEARPHLMRLPFDRWSSEVPYEERKVLDEALFASLPERARQPWDFTPMLEEFWGEVLRQARRTDLLGERFASARRTWERRWGCHNLELPVSWLCRTEPFAWFACHLLADLPRFHTAYNSSVHDYRRRHGIRSRHHPVPDLASQGDWLEAPFWAWRPGQLRRGRLMVRTLTSHLELRVGDEEWPSLARSSARLIESWRELETRGCKVRSRALTNTIYARLFLGDLFLHGIGGGKYDELTDELIRHFYGVEPPGYMVLSATLLLPLPAYPASIEDHRRLTRAVRDLYYNPQRHSDRGGSPLSEMAAQKQRWIEREPSDHRERRERFEALRSLTEQLRAPLTSRIQERERERVECEQQLQANAILQRRDYAFCLYPEAMLRPFCTQFLHQ